MTPRPLYRWKSFWLGILVLGFLGWAWSWSLGHYRSVWVKDGTIRWQVSSTCGAVTVERIDWGPAALAFGPVGSVASRVSGTHWRPLPPAFEKDPWMGYGYVGDPTWSVAIWFIALLFLLPWSAFLAWRWRRMRRAALLHSQEKLA